MSKIITSYYLSSKYEYNTQRGFFEYAFLEFKLSLEKIDVSYQDLYDDGYTNYLVNQLVENLR